MTNFVDDASAATLLRRSYVGHPEQRERPKRNAINVSDALQEARRVMAGNEHLKIIEDVLTDNIFNRIDKVVATYIPVSKDASLRQDFETIAYNLQSGDGIITAEYFERLDAALEAFRREKLGLFDQGPDGL